MTRPPMWVAHPPWVRASLALLAAIALTGCLDLFAEPTPPRDRPDGVVSPEDAALDDDAVDDEAADVEADAGPTDNGPPRVDGAPDTGDGACDGCVLDGADARCEQGRCVIERCHPGRADLDGRPENGCEYTCRADGVDDCNGIDDDCDGHVDESLEPPPVALPGVCRHARQICEGPDGWREPDYRMLDDYEVEESRCDGLDNDCDGRADEAHPRLGGACAVGVGACTQAGDLVCSADGWSLDCSARPGAPAAHDGTCDGVDDDCDGALDEDPPCNGCPAGIEIEAGYVCIPPGSFTMGSPPDEPGFDADEGPTRRVEITRPFLMLQTEVTRSLWFTVFAWDPSMYACDVMCVGEPVESCPVSRMSWGEAAKFANALTRQVNARLGTALTECYDLNNCNDDPAYLGLGCGEGNPGNRRAMPDPGQFCERRNTVPGCTGYRMPTEAEWEYAARAGDAGVWYGAEAGWSLDAHAWYAANADGRVHAAGLLAPSPWGLYDMLGNLYEMVDDYHRADGYAFAGGRDEVDPRGPAGSDAEPPNRAMRGGTYWNEARFLRSGFRSRQEQQDGFHQTGFRLVRTVEAPQ